MKVLSDFFVDIWRGLKIDVTLCRRIIWLEVIVHLELFSLYFRYLTMLLMDKIHYQLKRYSIDTASSWKNNWVLPGTSPICHLFVIFLCPGGPGAWWCRCEAAVWGFHQIGSWYGVQVFHDKSHTEKRESNYLKGSETGTTQKTSPWKYKELTRKMQKRHQAPDPVKTRQKCETCQTFCASSICKCCFQSPCQIKMGQRRND